MSAKQFLDKLKKELQEIDGRYTLRIDGISFLSKAKLQWLEAGDRPFVELNTPLIRQQVIRFVKAAIAEHGARNLYREITRVDGGEAIKRAVLLRFKEQGNDVSLRPLDPKYRAWKARSGYSTKIGIQTGTLLKELTAAEFYLVKVA